MSFIPHILVSRGEIGSCYCGCEEGMCLPQWQNRSKFTFRNFYVGRPYLLIRALSSYYVGKKYQCEVGAVGLIQDALLSFLLFYAPLYSLVETFCPFLNSLNVAYPVGYNARVIACSSRLGFHLSLLWFDLQHMCVLLRINLNTSLTSER